MDRNANKEILEGEKPQTPPRFEFLFSAEVCKDRLQIQIQIHIQIPIQEIGDKHLPDSYSYSQLRFGKISGKYKYKFKR